jgi:cation:H+ antiporter
MLYLIGFAACAAVLLFASKLVYEQIVRIADSLGVPSFLIALLIVALSTSVPELFVGLTSAVQGVPSFSLGDIFGSNIVNLTFIAGLVILVGRKTIDLETYIGKRELAITFAAASAPVLLLIDGTLSRTDGFILLALYAAYVLIVVTKIRKNSKVGIIQATALLKPILLFLVGVVCLIGASELIIYLATSLSTSLHVAPFVVGVFVIACSTSLPELAFGLRVALAKNPELSIADVVGSSAVNATAILGIVAVIHPIVPIALHTALMTGFFGVFIFIAFFLLVGRRKTSYFSGIILLLLYFAFASSNLLLT